VDTPHHQQYYSLLGKNKAYERSSETTSDGECQSRDVNCSEEDALYMAGDSDYFGILPASDYADTSINRCRRWWSQQLHRPLTVSRCL